MIRLPLLLLLLMPLPSFGDLYFTVIQGLDGSPEYGAEFDRQVGKLIEVSETVTDKKRVMVFSGEQSSRNNILDFFKKLSLSTKAEDRIAVFFIGHGSFDGLEYKFNIPGPDLTEDDLFSILDAQPSKVQLLIITSSASGAVMKKLKDDKRIIITATKSGNERLAPRFGNYFIDAFDDPTSDINKNNVITVQEAFDYAARQVKDYFELQGNLATEHPQLAGHRASQFTLARLSSEKADNDDLVLTHLINRRDQIDEKITNLQLRKQQMEIDEYLRQFQALTLDLALVQDQIDKHIGATENAQ